MVDGCRPPWSMNGKALFGLCVVWRYENCEICLASTSSFSLVTENGKYPRAGVTWSKSGWRFMRNLVLNNNASTVRGIFSCALGEVVNCSTSGYCDYF